MPYAMQGQARGLRKENMWETWLEDEVDGRCSTASMMAIVCPCLLNAFKCVYIILYRCNAFGQMLFLFADIIRLHGKTNKSACSQTQRHSRIIRSFPRRCELIFTRDKEEWNWTWRSGSWTQLDTQCMTRHWYAVYVALHLVHVIMFPVFFCVVWESRTIDPHRSWPSAVGAQKPEDKIAKGNMEAKTLSILIRLFRLKTSGKIPLLVLIQNPYMYIIYNYLYIYHPHTRTHTYIIYIYIISKKRINFLMDLQHS